MVRIRGRIGDWPVDLTVELDAADWERLAGRAAGVPSAGKAGAAADSGEARLWQLAQELLRQAGELDGPTLLARLEALAGSPAGGKRLLVRLRHSPRVQVASAADAALYRWSDAAEA